MLPPAYLLLEEDRVLVMTPPEPRRFVSRVKVFTKEGIEAEGTVEVNSPLTAGPWRVYQHGYDNAMGALSPWSRFLLVRDEWRAVTRVGLLMWILGSAGLVLSGRRPPRGLASGGAGTLEPGAEPVEGVAEPAEGVAEPAEGGAEPAEAGETGTPPVGGGDGPGGGRTERGKGKA
jgi:hypothetical protein